jgi:hypothetical protein
MTQNGGAGAHVKSKTGSGFSFVSNPTFSFRSSSSASASGSSGPSAETLANARLRAAASAAVEVAAQMSMLNIDGSSAAAQPMSRNTSGFSAESGTSSRTSSYGHPSQIDRRVTSKPALPLKEFMQDAKVRLMRKLRAPLSTVSRKAEAEREEEGEEEEDFVLIMGNDACDLDSVISSICLSYLLTVFPKRALERSPLSSSSQGSGGPRRRRKRTTYVPIIQSFQEDSRLRPENMLMLQLTLGGAPSSEAFSSSSSASPHLSGGADVGSIFRDADTPPVSLVWLDDVLEALQGWEEGEWRQKYGKAASGQTGSRKNMKASKQDLAILAASEKLSPSNGVQFGLVDHNRLGPLWTRPSPSDTFSSPTSLSRQVLLILDHHADERAHLSPTESALRIIKTPDTDPVGSCGSLVALLFKKELVVECANITSGLSEATAKVEGEDKAPKRSVSPSPSASALQTKSHVEKRKIPMAIPDLLLGPIALDTDNVSEICGEHFSNALY